MEQTKGQLTTAGFLLVSSVDGISREQVMQSQVGVMCVG